MNKERYDSLTKKYSSVISELINSNVRFYRFEKTIRWKFSWDDNISISITAVVDRKTNINKY